MQDACLTTKIPDIRELTHKIEKRFLEREIDGLLIVSKLMTVAC